jgi:hypothetical protein
MAAEEFEICCNRIGGAGESAAKPRKDFQEVLYRLFASLLPWNQMRNHCSWVLACAAQRLVIVPVGLH